MSFEDFEIAVFAKRYQDYTDWIDKNFPSERKAISVYSFNAVANMIKAFPELKEYCGKVNGCYVQYWCQLGDEIFDPTWRKFGNVERTYRRETKWMQ